MRKRKKMCIDEKTSWITFLLGSVLNYSFLYKSPNKTIRAVAVFWQLVLMVQLFEGLVWRARKMKNEKLCSAASALARLSTMIQPIVGLMIVTHLTPRFLPIAYVLMSVYIVSFAYFIRTSPTPIDECFAPSKACGDHLNHSWWTTAPSVLYTIVGFFAIFLIRPLPVAIAMGIFLAATNVLTRLVFPCAFSSMWCWFAAFAPIYTIITMST